MKSNMIYNYEVSIQYILNNKVQDLKSASISHIIIDYDYINKNMPIIYCLMNIDLAMFKTIINNENNGKFLLIIKKYEEGSSIKSTYLKGQFKYFIPTDRNEWNTEFTNKSGNETSANAAYKSTVVGLMSEEIIDNNSKIFNGIYSNTTSASIVHMATKDMKIIIEPFKRNYKLNQFIIPPMESINELLSFMNNYYPFYDTQYRYFIDFNQAYLISSNGNYVDNNDGDYKTINIDIQNRIIGDLDKGMIKDTNHNAYYLSTYLTHTFLKVNIYLESILNTINTINDEGIKNEEELDLLDDSIVKHYKYQRIRNVDTTTQLKNQIEDSIVKLSLSKTNIDTSIITPNKVYIVNNFEDNKQYNGRYILAKKQETFIGGDSGFDCITALELKRVKNK